MLQEVTASSLPAHMRQAVQQSTTQPSVCRSDYSKHKAEQAREQGNVWGSPDCIITRAARKVLSRKMVVSKKAMKRGGRHRVADSCGLKG